MTFELPRFDATARQLLDHPEFLKTLKGCRFGLEKEGLRVDARGVLSQSPHPKALGSKLTHPGITTDYSESLLEFVTGIHPTPFAALHEIDQLQTFADEALGAECIWPLSMPCQLPDDDHDIPLANYGQSHTGRLKTVYRRGLGYRYGRQMQTIAGLHFNLSFPDSLWSHLSEQRPELAAEDARQQRDLGYFHTIRNFRRIQWLMLLLTGASPTMHDSFRLLALDRFKIRGDTRLAPVATSLRMSDLGYQSAAQASINICFNQLETYCATLRRAVSQPWPPYEGIGLVDQEGFKQLNTAILQIENEYYSSIRPKRVQEPGERPVRALMNRGVQYLEVRAIDLNPFARSGLSETEAAFITLLMSAAALCETRQMSDDECRTIDSLNARAAWRGRETQQSFPDGRTFRDTALAWLAPLDALATCLDEAQSVTYHRDALEDARIRLSGDCPLLAEEVYQGVLHQGHLNFGLELGQHHQSHRRGQGLPAPVRDRLAELSRTSWEEDAKIAEADQGTFEDYVLAYVGQP